MDGTPIFFHYHTSASEKTSRSRTKAVLLRPILIDVRASSQKCESSPSFCDKSRRTESFFHLYTLTSEND